MNNKELKVVILDAKNGDEKATQEILDKYNSMIKTYSFVNGEIKEELKQDLTEVTIKTIKKFRIFNFLTVQFFINDIYRRLISNRQFLFHYILSSHSRSLF